MNQRSVLLLSSGFLFALFIIVAPFGIGVARATSPISISTCTQLQNIGATSTEPANGSYVLAQNIDCSATATWNPNGGGGYYGFSPLPDFTGIFNGAGYTISNLYISTTTISNVGLFSILDATSTVENLTLSGSNISGVSYVGALAGEMLATSTVQNVMSSSTVTDTQGWLGGLVGYAASANTTISSSSASGAITGSQNSMSYMGGLVGKTLGTISNSFSSASITSTGGSAEFIGGLVGYSSGSVFNSYASGTVVASGNGGGYVGGLIGDSDAAITNTYETGSVTVNGSNPAYIGGLIGYNYSGNVASSSASGITSATGFNSYAVGGFVGASNGGISNSYASGNVFASTTSTNVGGFDGVINNGTISQSYETGNVTGGYTSIGGFVGQSSGSISKSFSTGTVYEYTHGASDFQVAGFVGDSRGALQNDYSTGNIVIDPNMLPTYVNNFAGFVGDNRASISNSYSSGSIIGNGPYSYMGGFIGYNAGAVLNSYSTGGGTGLTTSTTTGTTGYFIGVASTTPLLNNAQYYQGAPAIGQDAAHSGSSDALLATHGYGTDDATLSDFYSTTESVYDEASTTAWDFNSIWETHPNALPTFQWFSPPTPTYTITASAGTGGVINNSGTLSVMGGANQAYNIIPINGYSIANVQVDGVSVGAISTYAFTNVSANHTISVTFSAPVISSSGGSSGGGTVVNQITNLITGGNTPAAAALAQNYPNLFPNGIAELSSSSTGSVSTTSFTRSLTLGSIGTDVKALQEYLNAHGFFIDQSGAGSAGNETTYFGKATRAALVKFQKAKGITPAVGYFGSLTRAYIASQS